MTAIATTSIVQGVWVPAFAGTTSSALRDRDPHLIPVTEIPARQMAECGHVLPEPGDEQMWLDGLPAEDRAYMQGVGR